MRWWQSINVRMVAGTSGLLLLVLTAVYGWRYQISVDERYHELEKNAALTATVAVRSFESHEPGKRPVHADNLARNLVELPNIHNIQVVAADGTISFSHHPEDVGQKLVPHESLTCRECHDATGVNTTSREFAGRKGTPLFHQGFAIENKPACQRCHDPKYKNLGMLLMSMEMDTYYDELANWRASLVWSGVVSLLVSVLSIALLFSLLVRRPLARLARQIQRVEGGDFDGLEPSQGRGEISAVHGAFTSMAARLRDAQQALEERVAKGSEKIDTLSDELELLYSNLMHLEHLSAMGTLSARMAHEIRTPLNAMGLNLQLLERGLGRTEGVDPSLAELLNDTGAEVQRVVSVLNQFMSRVRRPETDVKLEPLGTVVDSVAFLMAAEARRAGVKLRVDISDGSRLIEVNANHIRQIMTNLASNAIAAAPDGGVVRFRATVDGDSRPTVAVDDSGPGVPAELQERVFEPFFTTRDGGTGLGLDIVRHIVSDCGGELTLSDSDLGGASFQVALGGCHLRPTPDAGDEDSQ